MRRFRRKRRALPRVRLRFARVVASKKSAFFVVWRLLLFIFASRRVVPNDTVLKRETCWRERETIRFESNRFACFSLSFSLFLSLFFLTTTTTMMMTNTRCDAWLPSIELGTGVVIGQHFRARCAETFANNSESSLRVGRKEGRERERESRRTGVCVMFVPIRFFFPSSFLAACVRSSAGRLIPVVWSSEGFIYDCLQQTSEADTTVGSDLLGSESTQPSSSHFFRVCLFATMGRRRRR